MLKDLLSSDDKGSIISAITSKLGASEGEAGGFLDRALDMIESAIGSGQLDLDAILKGDFSSLKSALDLGSLGQMLGGGQEKGEQGLEAMMGPLQEKLSGSGDLSGVLGKLMGGESGGGAGDIMGKLGGMFGKK